MSWKIKALAGVTFVFIVGLKLMNYSYRQSEGRHLEVKTAVQNQAALDAYKAKTKTYEEARAAGGPPSARAAATTPDQAVKSNPETNSASSQTDPSNSKTEAQTTSAATSATTTSAPAIDPAGSTPNTGSDVLSPPAASVTAENPPPERPAERSIASVPAPVYAATPCDLDELRSQRLQHGNKESVSDEEWLCASSKNQARIHIVKPGESISSISAAHFGNYAYWPKIWAMNPDIENPHNLKVGYQIKLTESR